MKAAWALALLLVVLAVWTSQKLRAETNEGEAESPTSVFCISPDQSFSVESPTQWKFDETQSLTNGRCVSFTRIFDSTSAEISIFSFSGKPPANVIQVLTGIAEGDLSDVEQRKGDSLSVGGLEFSVLKYFPKTSGLNFVSVASSISANSATYVALSTPDRAAHDRFYQTFRDTVRTLHVQKSNGGVSH